MIKQVKYENSDGEDSFDVYCDDCEQEQLYDGDFYGMIKKIKGDGWKIRKSGGLWKHRCPDCVLEQEV